SWPGPALVVLVLPANFCSIHSSGLHSTATLILSDGSELAGLPSFSPPLRPKRWNPTRGVLGFAACLLPSGLQKKTGYAAAVHSMPARATGLNRHGAAVQLNRELQVGSTVVIQNSRRSQASARIVAQVSAVGGIF